MVPRPRFKDAATSGAAGPASAVTQVKDPSPAFSRVVTGWDEKEPDLPGWSCDRTSKRGDTEA